MALLLAASCESETPGPEITSLFSLIQDHLHRCWVYSCSAHGGSSFSELSTNPGGFVCCYQLFPCTGVNGTDSLRSGAVPHRKGTEVLSWVVSYHVWCFWPKQRHCPGQGKQPRCSQLVPWSLGGKGQRAQTLTPWDLQVKPVLAPAPEHCEGWS